MPREPWALEYYRDRRGTSPIVEFLRELDQSRRDSALRYLTMLQERGSGLRMPAARHIQGPIWELRPPRTRFLYAVKGRRIIVLAAFRKQKGEMPPGQVRLAFRRLAEIERREAE